MKKESTQIPNSKNRAQISDLFKSDKKRVLFVCLGNICRSPAAQGVLQRMVDERGLTSSFIIDSAGTGGYHVGELPDRRMRVHASRRGYELTHRARKFTPSDFDDFDIIIAMDNNNVYDLKEKARSTQDISKIVPMSEFMSKTCRYDYVPDPYYEGSEGFELVLDLLEEALSNFLDLTTER